MQDNLFLVVNAVVMNREANEIISGRLEKTYTCPQTMLTISDYASVTEKNYNRSYSTETWRRWVNSASKAPVSED